ncbi:glycosyltransferase family 2 protein [Aestuariibaculum suncheonense]|uniref:Glycosyltransferase family 2 protein n=1 Tax=Aestuariibaculum suncheonense TaxID=1028745 RepID=A0A8J6QBK2_9FLAO|nr:glycosyltransferase family 2 protein [Aestuariibaculum suncheonense]MBD0837026.1 glycosyltransferase family 2 protein [Aestuariibaculum suncheonense]
MLAIIIPFFKLAYFKATLDSLAKQTNKCFKVYIGDDASPEVCTDLLKQYAGQFDFVYHRFKDNLGSKSLTQQWVRCIELSEKEEWLMILGDDDCLSPNCVEVFYEHLEIIERTTNLVRFAKKIIDEDTHLEQSVQYNPELELAATAFYRRITGQTTITLSEYIFRRRVYLKYGFYDYPLAWHSDNRAWLEFAEDKPIYSINEAVVGVGCSALSITGSSAYKEQKRKASRLFYNYLVTEKLSIFDKKQAIRVLHKYENAIGLLRELTFKDRIFLMPYYWKNYESTSFKSNLKKILKTLFRSY